MRSFSLSVSVVAIIVVCMCLGGCSATSTADRYSAGENYGDGGKTHCGTHNVFEGGMPWCSPHPL